MGLLTESINGVIVAFKPIYQGGKKTKLNTALLFRPDEIFRQTDVSQLTML
jgi:hypothetical protein